MLRSATPALALAMALTTLTSACAPDGPDSGPSTTERSDEITSEVLLDAAERTVLDQTIEYPDAGDAQVTSAIIEIPPGVETGWHYHDVPLVAYVLAGTLTVTYDVDGEEVEKQYVAGESVLEAIGTHHNGRNDGDDTVQLVAVYMGADGVANATSL